jgi:hypothetical protein
MEVGILTARERRISLPTHLTWAAADKIELPDDSGAMPLTSGWSIMVALRARPRSDEP